MSARFDRLSRYPLLKIIIVPLVLYLASSNAVAHQMGAMQNRLDIVERDANQYDIRWRTSDPALSFILPKDCQTTGTFKNSFTLWRCDKTLTTRTVHVQGLIQSNAEVLTRIARKSGSVQVAILSAQKPNIAIADGPHISGSVALNYLWLGVIHILLGFDHILFVLALMLLITQRTPLIKTITAFTLGHSATLALAIFGWVKVNPIFVEVLIALSILFLAAEALEQKRGKAHLTTQKPWLVALGFGLLHGLGFANVLTELGLPKGEEIMALATFNLGVEVGQVAFVVIVWPLLQYFFYGRTANASPIQQPPVMAPSIGATTNKGQALHLLLIYGIGSIAAFWFTQRTVQMYSPFLGAGL